MKNIKTKERRNKLLEATKRIEPTFDPPLRDQDIRLSLAYTWYNQNFTLDEGKQWFRELLRKEGADSTFINSITNGYVPMVCGTISRLMLRGIAVPQHCKNYLKKYIQNHTPVASTTAAVVAPKPIDVNQEKIDSVVHAFNTQVDSILDGSNLPFSFYSIIKKNELKKNLIHEVESIILPQTQQLLHAVKVKNSPWAEYYENHTKQQMKNLAAFYTNVASDIKRCLGESKTIRKPRKQKPVLADKVVSKLQYKREDKEFKITSIDPKNIIDTKMLIVFNTKYKQMSVYVAQADKRLSIKGTTVLNYDESKSIRKVIRKPDESINSVLRGNDIHVMRYITGLSTRGSEPSGRINSDTCILRAIK